MRQTISILVQDPVAWTDGGLPNSARQKVVDISRKSLILQKMDVKTKMIRHKVKWLGLGKAIDQSEKKKKETLQK